MLPAVGQRVWIKHEGSSDDPTNAPQGKVIGYSHCIDESDQQLLAIVRLTDPNRGYLNNDYFKAYISTIVAAPNLLEAIPMHEATLSHDQTRKLLYLVSSRMPLSGDTLMFEDAKCKIVAIPYHQDEGPKFLIYFIDGEEERVTGPVSDVFNEFHFRRGSVRFFGSFV